MQDTLRDLLGGIIKGIMQIELNEYLGYEMYAKEMTTKQISDTLGNIYGFEAYSKEKAPETLKCITENGTENTRMP